MQQDKQNIPSEAYCQNRVNRYPFYSPRFWAGMRFTDYAGMLLRNRLRINPLRLPMTALVGGCSVMTSCLSVGQAVIYNRRIRETELVEPPIFVIGHWRSGTTLLHELIAQDDRFAWPSTLECFLPTNFLFSQPLLGPLVRMLMPKKRPMDSMPMGADLPQEDEFALIGIGAPTPYYQIAFCNDPQPYVDMLNLENASEKHVEELRVSLEWFYKSLTLKKQKRLVLKSPTHTGRIAHLQRWFPGARFVHITRHPHKVFPSTMHLWKSLAAVQGYQLPDDSNDERLAEYVHRCYLEMYGGFFDQVDQISEKNFLQVRFEDLVQDPISQMHRIYDAFQLGEFETARPRLERFWGQRRSHRKNQTELSHASREQVNEIWSDYFERFGYPRNERTSIAG